MKTTKKPAKKTPTKTEAEPQVSAFDHDPRVLALYPIGSHIEKRSRDGKLLARLTVTAEGFLWHGKTYGALSPIATEISGTQRNGLTYFGIIPVARAARSPEELAPAFDAAVRNYNAAVATLPGSRSHIDMQIVVGLHDLIASTDHAVVRKAVAALRAHRARLAAEIKAIEEGENLLETHHGRVQDAEAEAA